METNYPLDANPLPIIEKHIYPCQYCGTNVERTSRADQKMTCFDCKAERQREYARRKRIEAVGESKPREYMGEKYKRERREWSEAQKKRRESDVLDLLYTRQYTFAEIGARLTPAIDAGLVSKIVRGIEDREGITLPRKERNLMF